MGQAKLCFTCDLCKQDFKMKVTRDPDVSFCTRSSHEDDTDCCVETICPNCEKRLLDGIRAIIKAMEQNRGALILNVD